jgi:hypothetical protein
MQMLAKLHIALFSSGERFPVLLNTESGQPLLLPTRYIIDARREFRQSGTIANDLRAISWFYNWARDQQIDVEARIRGGQMFTSTEIGGFASFLRSGRQKRRTKDSM